MLSAVVLSSAEGHRGVTLEIQGTMNRTASNKSVLKPVHQKVKARIWANSDVQRLLLLAVAVQEGQGLLQTASASLSAFQTVSNSCVSWPSLAFGHDAVGHPAATRAQQLACWCACVRFPRPFTPSWGACGSTPSKHTAAWRLADLR